MSQGLDATCASFVDRRNYEVLGSPPPFERRQFTNSHEELSAEARELALAIDGYKMRHRRRFINSEEMLAVINPSYAVRGPETPWHKDLRSISCLSLHYIWWGFVEPSQATR
jgi:hypothetical protein